MAFTSGNDQNILQATDSLDVGAGAGNDKYILAANNLSAGQIINITDADGANTLQLIGGLTIASSVVSANALQLTLSNGAVVNVFGADNFSYEVGGNPLTGTPGAVKSFSAFVTTSLGVPAVPTTGIANGTPNGTVNADGTISYPVVGTVGNLFTLAEPSTVIPEVSHQVLMWGYKPIQESTPPGEVGHELNIPVADLQAFVRSIAGIDFFELGLIDSNGVEVPGAIKNITIADITSLDGSTLTITLADGTVVSAEASLGKDYLAFLGNLIFDKNGNSRLYMGDVVTQEAVYPDDYIWLTPTKNNGGTLEAGLTTVNNDTLVAGRTELLHQAYLDGGAGYDTLEVDMKGEYAQPLQLLNIEQINVQNLPNVYTTVNGTSIYPNLSADAGTHINSFLDLSHATSLQKLVVTEGGARALGGLGGVVPLGDLSIVGIRANATTRLEGGFTQAVNLSYGQGQTGAVNLELLLGDTQNFNLNVAHNASVLNIDSQGYENYLQGVHFFNNNSSASLAKINISGEGALFIQELLDGDFRQNRTATVDAHANTGGVQLGFHGQSSVNFIGSSGNDKFTSLDSSDVTITSGVGNNEFITDRSQTVNITSLNGNDTISSVDSGVVTINAGGGNNTITTSALEINITTGAGNDKVFISGMDTAYLNGDLVDPTNTDNNPGDLVGIGESAKGALLNIDLGAGVNTITLGRDYANPLVQDGITALEGSSITGSNIALFVENTSDLAQASLTGITKVTLKQELTISDDQFKAIGASAFATYRAAFGATEDLHIIVDSDANLTDLLNGQALSLNVRLSFELHNGATLSLTAEQLHKYLAEGGLVGADGLNGKVVVTGAGNNFDPFDNGGNQLVIDGGTIAAGNLYGAEDVTIIRDGTYERPVVGGLSDSMTLGSLTATDPLVIGSALVTEAQTLKLIGAQDIQFKGVVDLGGESSQSGKDVLDPATLTPTILGPNGNVETDAFVVDFSTLTGKVTGLTLDHFQDVRQIKGNGVAGTRIDVILNADVGTAGVNKGLNTSGVETYMVTRIDTDQDGAPDGASTVTIHLCDLTQDVKFIGLKGNAGSTLILDDVPWGKVAPHIVLEGDGYANASDALKVDGSPNTSDIGNITAIYNSTGAVAVVDINNGGVELGVTATGAERKFAVGTITLTNAASATINVKEGDVTIKAIDDGNAIDTLASVKFVATEDVKVTDQLPAKFSTIDASGVAGAFTATLGDTGSHTFALTGGAGGVNLTLNAVVVNHTIGLDDNGSSIDGGALGANLTVSASSDLAYANLTNINKVTLNNGTAITLSLAQVNAIDVADIKVAAVGNTGTLNLVGLDNTPFSVGSLTAGIAIGTVELAANPAVTLDPTTNLTGVGTLVVPDGTTLTLSAAQFQQLGLHTITGSGIAGSMGTVNITGLKQSDIDKLDLNGDGDTIDAGEHAGFSLAGVTGVKFGTVTLAESVTLTATDSLGTFKNIVMGNDMTLGLADIQQGNGLIISGGTNTTVQFNDTSATVTESIDASGYGVNTIKVLNVLVAGRNVDLMFDHLPGSVVKEIYNDLGFVNLVNQIVTIDAGTTVPGNLTFNPITNDTELHNFTLNMAGGTEITGSLNLATTAKVVSGTDQMRTHLDTLTINSTGTAANLLNGKTANTIVGDITPLAAGGTTTDNNLLNVAINATQALVVNGDTVFSSVVGDDAITGNDDYAAVAKLTVTGTADVTLGTVNTSDDEVDSLVVANNGTGTLSLTLDAAKLDQVKTGTINNDALSFTGSKIALTVDDSVGSVDAVNLSDDVLTGVSKITLGKGALGGEVILTQAQYNTLGGANLVDDGSNLTSAVLRLVEFGSASFDATTVGANITLASITLAAGAVTLAPTTNLTGVGTIFIQEGSTLNLTAAQFQQLSGKGTIVGVDTDGNGTVGTYTVNITDLKQADVERAINPAIVGDTAGLDLTGIAGGTGANAPKVNISLGDSTVTLGKFDSLGALTLPSVLGVAANQVVKFILADNQTLAFVNSTQADGRAVTGGLNSTLVLKFDAMDVGDTNGIDAAGYNVTTLKALATFVDGEDIEFLLLNVASSIQERYYVDPLELGLVKATNRVAVVEAGVTVPGYVMYNDPQTDKEVRTLDLTLSGGSKISGDVNLSTIAKSGTLQTQFFDTLTLHSVGTTANTITGNILATGADISPNVVEVENNLLKVVIDATQALKIGGDIVFTQENSKTTNAVANLTITGTANVTVEQLDVSDAKVATLNIANNGTGTFTVTGASPALFDGNAAGTDLNAANANLESLVLSGSGNIVLGSNPDVSTEWGITAVNLSVINASALTGNLDLGVIKDVDSENFAFTSGSGVTKLTMTNDSVDMNATNNVNNVADTGWSFNFTNAAVGSEFHLGAGMTYGNNANDTGALTTTDKLDIKLGINTTLYIDADTDFTAMDIVTISGTKDIVLAKGVDLTLTAAQASGLKIVPAADVITDPLNPLYVAADVPKVHLTNLGTAAYDLSGIASTVAGEATLAADDVSLAATTDLGGFTVQLLAASTSDATLAGQTIRFSTVAQADNAVSVVFPDGTVGAPDGVLDQTGGTGNSSTNVVWLFNSIVSPVDTSKYDAELGRLLFNAALVNSFGGLVENLFTTLPSSILRVDFATVAALNILLNSTVIDRTMEFSNFTTVGNLTYSDIGLTPVEHLHSLNLVLGGQATIGNVLIDDIIPAAGYNPLGANQFTTLTVDSYLALTGRTAASIDPDGAGPLPVVGNPNPNQLASEAYVNNNNGINTAGETAQPNNINTVGNIGVGAANGLDLIDVKLNTHGVSVYGNGSAGDGAKLNVGTITYGYVPTALAPTAVAALTVTGANDINITSVVKTDVDITGLTVTSTGFTGVLTAPGTSPGLQLDNTQTLTFIHADVGGTITLGRDAAGPVTANAGVAGNELSFIKADQYNGTLNLGIIAQIDSTNDTADLNGDGDLNDNVGGVQETRAFTFTSGQGITTATLAAANGLTPTLNAGSEWSFDYTGADAGSYLKINASTVFQAGSTLRLNNVPLKIEGAVDLSILVDNPLTPSYTEGLFITGGSLEVLAGATLTLTVAQVRSYAAAGIDIIGAGTVKVKGDDSNPTVPGVDAPLGANLKTVGVDLSGVTLIASPALGFDTDATVKLTVADANSGTASAPIPAGHIITDSANNDLITVSGTTSHTINVTGNAVGGGNTIVGLRGDVATGVGTVHDVLNVSSGATATATLDAGVNFVATAATINSNAAVGVPVVTINGAAIDNTTIDMTLAGGTKGFTITGGTSGVLGADTLTGSAQDDIINGGSSTQTAALAVDTLKGNGGNDTFVFNINSQTATLTVANTTSAIDRELLTFTADAADNNNEFITVNYKVDGAPDAVLVNLTGINVTDLSAVAIAMRDGLEAKAGIGAVLGANPGEVVVSGDVAGNGGSSLEITSVVPTGTFTTLGAVASNGADQAQVTTLTVSGAPTPGDVYNILANFAVGGGGSGNYMAVGGNTAADIATGLSTSFNVGGITDSALAGVVTFTDATPDDGGFVLKTDTTAAFGGSGASVDLNTSPATLASTFSDVVLDFTAVNDSIKFTDLAGVSLGAGTALNFSAGAAAATYAAAFANANAALGGGVIYYLTSETADNVGLLFFDANNDGNADGVVQLTGVTSANFGFADIV